jgi:hypothetical protein
MKAWITASAALLTLALGANAQEPPAGSPFAAVHAACEKDIQTYCASTQPRTPEHMQCIKANEAKFSKPCQDALANMRKAMGNNPPPPKQ